MNMEIKFLLFSIRISSKQWFSLILHVQQYMFWNLRNNTLIWFICYLQFSQHLRVQYDELVPPLCKNYPDVFLPELYTWEQFLWACELWYSNSMKVMFVDGKLRTCLIPIAGFLNHSVYHSFLVSPFFCA